MRFLAALLFMMFVSLAAHPAHADQATVREIARTNNCTPKKIEIYQQSVGEEGQTVYLVTCNVPKMADANAPKTADGLLVTCRDSLCQLLRPHQEEGKK